jgi:hypothetical protein
MRSGGENLAVHCFYIIKCWALLLLERAYYMRRQKLQQRTRGPQMVDVAASAGLQPSSSLQVSYSVASQGPPTRFVSFACCYHARFCSSCNLTVFL